MFVITGITKTGNGFSFKRESYHDLIQAGLLCEKQGIPFKIYEDGKLIYDSEEVA